MPLLLLAYAKFLRMVNMFMEANMIRKLSLLLAMVLAMTMVMGIGVTAFAEIDPPVSHIDPCHC